MILAEEIPYNSICMSHNCPANRNPKIGSKVAATVNADR